MRRLAAVIITAMLALGVTSPAEAWPKYKHKEANCVTSNEWVNVEIGWTHRHVVNYLESEGNLIYFNDMEWFIKYNACAWADSVNFHFTLEDKGGYWRLDYKDVIF